MSGLRRLQFFSVVLVCCCAAVLSPAQQAATGKNTAEAKTARRLEAIRNSPPRLRAFLADFPKGADLHMHLSGAIYAETFLRDAADDNLCADPVKLALVQNTGLTPTQPARAICPEGTVPVQNAFTNQKLYDALVDSFSMRAFVPSAGTTGHDQFFATFGRFGSPTFKLRTAEWVDEVASRAAAQNEQYLEIMHTPDASLAVKLSKEHPWTGDFAAMRETLLQAGLRDNVATAQAELAAVQKQRASLEHCGTAQATPACKVQVHFLYQVLRATPPAQVFAQTLLGFELANAGPDVVGVNLVQPEDAYMSMSQYNAHMDMLHYLRTQYPKVHLSLHAGELAPGMVPPDGLGFHIRDAVERAGAERIGHGVDVASEAHAASLLREMAQRHIDVEINLTSNDVILGVSGATHPLAMYREAGVPFSLSTDDEGVSRIDLTNEYMRAVTDQKLDYAALKQSARNSLEYSFLPGESLYPQRGDYGSMAHGCTRPASPDAQPSGPCAAFLQGSERATQQWELERRFAAFERQTATASPR